MLGLLLDCRDKPTLVFFVNGAKVCRVFMTEQVEGEVVYPAFCLDGDGAIEDEVTLITVIIYQFTQDLE